MAGRLEPSHDAGGDSFDYSLEREHFYLSITDAMGDATHAAPAAHRADPVSYRWRGGRLILLVGATYDGLAATRR